MTPYVRLGIASGVATAMGALSLSAVYDDWDWLLSVLASLVLVTAAGIGARRLRVPGLLVALIQVGAAVLFITWLFAGSVAVGGILPGPAAVDMLYQRLAEGFNDMRLEVAPTVSSAGLTLLTILGCVGVATVVDLLAVWARQPAAAGLALLGLYAIPSASLTGQIPWLLFILGASGYLLLLYVDEREKLSRWGRSLTHRRTAGLAALSGQRIAVVAVLAGLIVPLAVPVLPEGFFQLGENGSGGGGAGSSINPMAQLEGQLREPVTREMFYVRVNVDDPFYLRLVPLEEFTGTGWTIGGLRADADAEGDLPVDSVSVGTRSFNATVTVEELNDRFLPSYYSTSRVDADGAWRYDAGLNSIYSRSDTTGGLAYRLSVVEPQPTVEDLQAADPGGIPPEIQQRFTLLPDDVRPEIRTIVDEITANATTAYERTLAINDYFSPSNGFSYSVSTEDGTSDDLLVDFLQNKRGFCQQYAAAMGVMMRLANIPSRVVVGFTRGQQQDDGRWLVTNKNAHAWVEGYFAGIGWVPFDPTPPGARGTTDIAWAPEVEATSPELSAGATAPNAPSALPTGQLEQQNPGETDASSSDSAGLLSLQGVLVLVGILLVVAIAVTPSFLRWRLRIRRIRAAGSGPPGAAAHAAWDEVMSTAIDHGRSPPRSDTPRGSARRLARDMDFDQPALDAARLVVTAEERARYAPADQAVVEGDLAAATRTLNKAITEASQRSDRIRARLLPRTTMDRLRTSLRSRSRTQNGQDDPTA